MIARMEDKLVDFECGVADFMCGTSEQVSNWVADLINWLAKTALGAQSFRPGDELWNTAQDETGMWLGMAIFVMMITFTVGIAAGAVMQRPDLIKRTVISSIESLPAFYFAYFIVGQGLQIIDEFSGGILERLTGAGGFAGMIEKLFSAQANWGAQAGLSVIGAAPVGQMMLILIIMCVGLLFITFAMAFRDFVLMILIAFAPLAFMLLPGKGLSDEWMKRWMSAVTAMALAKPLILGTLVLVMAGFGKIETIWSGAGLTLAIGVFITAFMPILAYSFFQFMGGGTGGDEVGQRMGGMATQRTQRGVSFGGRRMPNGGGGGAPKPVQGAPKSQATSAGGGGAKPGANGADQKSQGARPGQGPAAGGRLGAAAAAPGQKPPVSQPPSPRPAPQIPRGPKQ